MLLSVSIHNHSLSQLLLYKYLIISWGQYGFRICWMCCCEPGFRAATGLHIRSVVILFWQYYHWNLGYLCSAQPDWIELTVHIFPFITGDDSAVVFTTQIQDSKSVCNNNSFKPLFGMFIYFPMRSICCAKSSEMLMGPRWPLKLQNWD